MFVCCKLIVQIECLLRHEFISFCPLDPRSLIATDQKYVMQPMVYLYKVCSKNKFCYPSSILFQNLVNLFMNP